MAAQRHVSSVKMAAETVNFRGMQVGQLKNYLTGRGIPNKGKKKDELVELAVRAQGKYELLEKCDHVESERKRRRVERVDGTVIDLNDRVVTWTKNLSQLPMLTLGEVFAYLLQHCEWTPQRMAKYKQDDGYGMFMDEHIECVEYGEIEGHDQHCYVKSAVRPEQRQSAGAQRYNSWILLCVDAVGGEIKSAGCGCVAA